MRPPRPALTMLRAGSLRASFAPGLVLAALSAAPAVAQPAIDLPPELPDAAGEPRAAAPKPAAIALPRESQIGAALDPHAAASGTAIGGYGEIVLNAPLGEPTGTTVDVRRLVIYVGHNFTERLRLYAEIEIEHAITSSTDRGETEVEQAFVDYVFARAFALRAGLFLMPVGIVNQQHEPPTFHGVDRPDSDLYLIPSTWREVGAGAFGALGPVRYQLYACTGFDAKGFTADGLRDGHQEGQLARAHDPAGVARLEVLPFSGFSLALSGYLGRAGQNQPALGNPTVGIVEADAALRWKGLEARAQFANVWIGGTETLNPALVPTDGSAGAGPVSRQLRGGYVEAGYNLLRPFRARLKYESALIAFGRYERTNTQAEVLDFPRAPGHDREAITFGLTFRPIAEVSIKLDYQRRSVDTTDGTRHGWNQLDAGLGFMF